MAVEAHYTLSTGISDMGKTHMTDDLTTVTNAIDPQHLWTESDRSIGERIAEGHTYQGSIFIVLKVLFSHGLTKVSRKVVVLHDHLFAPREKFDSAVFVKKAVHSGLICDKFDILRSSHGIPQRNP